MKLKPNHSILLCSCCQGTGLTSAYLGTFTQDSLNQDPDFAEAYLNGDFDRVCQTCDGAGRIQVPNSVENKESDEHVETAEEKWKLRCAEDGIPYW